MKFSNISTTKELKNYLNSPNCQKKSFYHYTSLEKFEKIKSSKCFFLSSFEDMNDVYEAESIDSDIKKNTFIGSFSRNESESIAMWYMYGHPHNQSIRIEIESKIMKQWIKDIQLIGMAYVVENFKSTTKSVKIKKSIIHTISYYEPSKKKFYWSNQQLFCHNNHELQNFKNDLDIHGYIKHAAWDYEEEMRLTIRTNENDKVAKIAIPIPDYVINNMKVMTGPNFDNYNLLSIDFQKSILTGKVRL